MWQKSDNGKEVTFAVAQAYCQNLRLAQVYHGKKNKLGISRG